MRIEIETQEIFIIGGIKYVVEKASLLKRKVGRPCNKMAKYSILLRRFTGIKLYQSFIYNDGSICKPF